MRSNTKNNFQKYILFIFFVLLFIQSGQAQSLDSLFSKLDFSGSVSFSQNYNDNILDYSPRDIDSLNSGVTQKTSDKYSISEPSDYITTIKAKGGIIAHWFKKNPTIFNIRLSHNFYGNSHIKNNTSWGIEFKQTVKRKNYVTVGLSGVPNNYLRNLKFRRPKKSIDQRYIEVFLNKRGYSFEVGREIVSNTIVDMQYNYFSTDYTTEFDERNNHSNEIVLEGRTKLSREIEISGAYLYDVTKANGSTAIPDSVRVSGVTKLKYRDDVSSTVHRGKIGIDFSFKQRFQLPLKWSTDFIYEKQEYNTTQSLNKYYGRKDSYVKIATEFSFRFEKNYELSLQYYWEENTNSQNISNDFGSYQTHQIGCSFEYHF